MKRYLTALIMMAAVALTSAAQQPAAPSDPDPSQWAREVRDFKHAFLARELNLSREQQNKFFKTYDAMDDAIAQVNSETRRLERKLADTPQEDVTDLEYDVTTEALFSLKGKEAEIEAEYYPQLKEVLTKRQLFLLKGAERKFNSTLMRRHHDLRNKPRRARGDKPGAQ